MKIIGMISAGVVISVLGIYLGSDDHQDDYRIRIAYFPNIGHAAPIVGMEKGFIQERIGEGISVESRIFDSGPQAIESLFAGSVDVAYVGPGPAINGFLKSEDNRVRILAGAASGGASFVVHPDSEINSISDFEGKRIAAPQIGNTQDVSLRHALYENGLTPAEKGGTVTIYNIPNPDIYMLFVKGEIDGAWVAEPWATVLEGELNGTRLFREESLWPDEKFVSVLLIGNSDYIGENPQIISDLLASHRETISWINENPRETAAVFNDFLESYLGRPLPDDVVDTALSHLVITADPLPGSVDLFAKKADALGYLGRDGYSLSGIFYHGSNSVGEAGT